AMTGVVRLRWGASAVAASRRCCAGVTIKMISARAARAMSPVISMPGSMRIPGNRKFSRVAFIRDALQALRAYSTTWRPARDATLDSAVPHAPAPITATVLKLAISYAPDALPRPALAGRGLG